MMDVQELRSFFVTKEVKASERVASTTSGGEFDETLSCCSQKREPFSEGSPSDEEEPGRSGADVSDTGKAGESCDAELHTRLSPPKGTVPDVPDDFKGEQGALSSRGVGAKAYHQLLPGGVVSQKEVLLDDLRQLKRSAHVFGAKAGQGGGASDGNSQDVFETEEKECSAAYEGLTGVLVEGILPQVVNLPPVHDGVFSGGVEWGAPLSDGVTLKEQQGVSAEKLSLPVDDFSGSLPRGQEGAFSFPFIREEKGADLSQEDLSDGSGPSPVGLPASPQAYVMGEGVAFPIGQEGLSDESGSSPAGSQADAMREDVVFPADETVSASGQGAFAPASAGRQDPLPELLTREEVPLPVKDGQGGNEPGSDRENGFVDGNPLMNFSRSGSESAEVSPAPSILVGEKGVPVGETPEILRMDQGEILSGEVPEAKEDQVLEAKEDQPLPSSFAVNPMEGTPVNTSGGDISLEARGVEAMARGLAETIHVVRKREGHTGTIQVNPPHLGQVNITVDSSGDRIQIHLRVESVEVRDMLNQTADVLKQALADKGVSLTGMSVDVGGQGAGGSSQGRGSGSGPVPGYLRDDVAEFAEDETEEIVARLDLEHGMLHWVA